MYGNCYLVPLVYLLCSFVSIPFLNAADPDVISYDLHLVPDIDKGSIKGDVRITFKVASSKKSITFSKGKLQVLAVAGKSLKSHKVAGKKLIIELLEAEAKEHQITVSYQGNPKRGLFFDQSLDQAYTVFSTSQWMICNDDPADKATISMDILLPKAKQCVASGELKEVELVGEMKRHRWIQNYKSPSYTYGFVIGNFQESKMKRGEVTINNYASDYNTDELNQIFKETPEIITFFEEKSGVKYGQSSYNQLLIGDYYQEMSGFSILKNSYGKLVLKDTTETNLISHELAHQWWGNRITCKDWRHFWLNEAMATFMSAAYNEHRFGEEKYNSDINSYKRVYEDIKSRGFDKPLVFDNWLNPSRDDRNIVYFKGAYVLHLLRQEVGDQAFWNGIKVYSKQYFNHSVSTADFQKSMETGANRKLNAFFNQWVY